jgi:hypothetical protein
MKLTLANAIRNGLPTITQDLYTKCDSSKYYLKLVRYENRDKDAVVYDESINYDQKSNYDIILCLYYNKKCISSVVGRYHASDNSMEILSKTHTDFENKKFNLYLRTAFIYLMCFVRPTINKVFSFSENPISTYTMYKYYHASNEDLDTFSLDNHLTPDSFTVEDAKKFHEYFINKNKKTKEIAEVELKEMLEDYDLDELGWNSNEEAIDFIINNMSIQVIQLTLSLQTPTIKEFLLAKLSNIMIKCNEVIGGTRKKKIRKQRKMTKSNNRIKKYSKTRH